MFAQLRDVLTAEDSAIVAKKNDDGGLALPQRTQTDISAIDVRENDVCEMLAESFLHVESSLSSQHSSVKAAMFLLLSRRSAPDSLCPQPAKNELLHPRCNGNKKAPSVGRLSRF